ncbi:MAG: aminoacyl-tRNA hydrolase [Neisseriaceae bacterium]|nr:MAG: aminoacyl-tRNA hydrolase [Neisseriaceae bacterium]
MVKIRLIVGLGNPGSEYDLTRHNIGFLTLDVLAKKRGVFFKAEKKFLAEITKIQFLGDQIILMKPNTFMNLSGQAVGVVSNYFKIRPEEILVIHDELDLQPGRIKLKKGGNHGGHNGLKDIDAKLGSNAYYRLRIGIGHPRDCVEGQKTVNSSLFGLQIPDSSRNKKLEVPQYVLKRPSIEDQVKIEHCIERIHDNLESILEANLEVAQRHLHSL